MYKEVTLAAKKEGVEKFAHILIYDDINQLKDFYDKFEIEYEKSVAFVYKSIDENNKIYIIRTKAEVTEETLNADEFLERIVNILNNFGKEDLLSKDKQWSIGYVAEQFGIEIKWKKYENLQ